MKSADAALYVCPARGGPLDLRNAGEPSREVVSGSLIAGDGTEYFIRDGVPDLTYPPRLPEPDGRARSFYDERAEAYDQNLHLTFKTHGEDELKVRRSFIDKLELKASHRVLEVSCGTGRDSAIIAERLDHTGHLCLQDISPVMLERCRKRLAAARESISFCVSNACYLPYPDKYFDAVYSFGGLGEFSDIARGLAEMARVSKVGARIVVGDESIPPWLRGTEYAGILSTTNPQFLAEVPFASLPVAAREVCVRWVIGGVFYLIDFKVGEGEPSADFDFEIPGPRGGTYRSRYEAALKEATLGESE
jgi:ubiquinone/menaquinone biosynthesis C-methylase UbiE